MNHHASPRRLLASMLALIALAAFADGALAQLQVRPTPHPSGCQGAVVRNVSGKRLDVTLKYIYRGQDGSYFSWSEPLGPMAHGDDRMVSLLSGGPVNCLTRPRLSIDYAYTDLDAVARQHAERERRMLQREREEQMALARLLDERNRRAAEARQQAQIRQKQIADERARQISADRQAAANRPQQYTGQCPRNVSC